MTDEKKRRKKIHAFDVINSAILILFGLCCLYPFVNQVMISFSSQADFYNATLFVLPKNFNLDSYIYIIYQDNIGTSFLISIFVAVAGTAYSMCMTVLGAYVLTKKDVPGRKLFFVFVLITMFFGGGQAKHIVKGHDYIHIYAKRIGGLSLSRKKEIEITPKMKEINGHFYIKNDDVIRKTFGKYDKTMDRRCFYEELLLYKGEKKKNEVDQKIATGEYFLEERNGMHVICEYLPVEGARAKLYSIIKVLSEEGKKELNNLGITIFDYPKPLSLIQQLCDTNNKKNSVVLDFFAGSGTTGHAVMKLNAEDGGNRKFILCTNNENNICRDVTYERIKRVIAKEDYKASLKYFKVDYLPISDKLYYEYADELLKHIRELVELENGIDFNGNNEIAIVLTEAELDDFVANIPETCKAIYVGHDVLPTEEQEKIFAKNKIKVNVIPEYYYRDLEG